MARDKKIYFSIATPYFLAYLVYVWKTPGYTFSNSSPYWQESRVILELCWIVFIYWFRWVPAKQSTWSNHNFLAGAFTGGGFLFGFLLYQNIWSHPAMGIIASSTLVSALFATPSKTIFKASIAGLLCLILQTLVHELIFSWWDYIE